MGNIASVALFCLWYGGAMLVFDPTLRVGFEAVAFVCIAFMGPFFSRSVSTILDEATSFARRVSRLSPPYSADCFPHSDRRSSRTRLDSASVRPGNRHVYHPTVGVFWLLFSIGTAAVGSLLLMGAILNYGFLYRQEATAVTLSTVSPTAGLLLWVFEVRPIPQLPLTAPLMLFHVTLDAYAFVGTHMFETNPVTQRVAERTGLDSLSEPVFIFDTE